MSASAGEPAAGVTGEVVADGQAIALRHGIASATTMGGDDPITFVRLTQEPLGDGPRSDMDAISGKAGAMLAIHLHASGGVFQVMALHPKADASFPTELPKESVKVSGHRVDGREIVATIESDGEIRADGHVWTFRFELRLPIAAD